MHMHNKQACAAAPEPMELQLQHHIFSRKGLRDLHVPTFHYAGCFLSASMIWYPSRHFGQAATGVLFHIKAFGYIKSLRKTATPNYLFLLYQTLFLNTNLKNYNNIALLKLGLCSFSLYFNTTIAHTDSPKSVQQNPHFNIIAWPLVLVSVPWTADRSYTAERWVQIPPFALI